MDFFSRVRPKSFARKKKQQQHSLEENAVPEPVSEPTTPLLPKLPPSSETLPPLSHTTTASVSSARKELSRPATPVAISKPTPPAARSLAGKHTPSASVPAVPPPFETAAVPPSRQPQPQPPPHQNQHHNNPFAGWSSAFTSPSSRSRSNGSRRAFTPTQSPPRAHALTSPSKMPPGSNLSHPWRPSPPNFMGYPPDPTYRKVSDPTQVGSAALLHPGNSGPPHSHLGPPWDSYPVPQAVYPGPPLGPAPDQSDKSHRKTKPIFDERQKSSVRFSHLTSYLDSVESTEKTWFFQTHADTVFTVLFDTFVDQLDKIQRRTEVPDSPNAKEIIAIMRIFGILRKLLYNIPGLVRAGWHSQKMDPLNHPQIVREGFILLIEWMNLQGSYHEQTFFLFRDALIQRIFLSELALSVGGKGASIDPRLRNRTSQPIPPPSLGRQDSPYHSIIPGMGSSRAHRDRPTESDPSPFPALSGTQLSGELPEITPVSRQGSSTSGKFGTFGAISQHFKPDQHVPDNHQYDPQQQPAGPITRYNKPITATDVLDMTQLVLSNIKMLANASVELDGRKIPLTTTGAIPGEHIGIIPESLAESPSSVSEPSLNENGWNGSYPWRITGHEALTTAQFMFQMFKQACLFQLFPTWAHRSGASETTSAPKSFGNYHTILLKPLVQFLVDCSIPRPAGVHPDARPADLVNKVRRHPELAHRPWAFNDPDGTPWYTYITVNQVLFAQEDNLDLLCEILRQSLLLPIRKPEHSELVSGAIGVIRNWLFGSVGGIPIFLAHLAQEDYPAGSIYGEVGQAAGRRHSMMGQPTPFYQLPSTRVATQSNPNLPLPSEPPTPTLASTPGAPPSQTGHQHGQMCPNETSDSAKWWAPLCSRYVNSLLQILAEPLRSLFALGDMIPPATVASCQKIFDLLRSLATEQPLPLTEDNWQLLMAILIGTYETLPMNHVYRQPPPPPPGSHSMSSPPRTGGTMYGLDQHGPGTSSSQPPLSSGGGAPTDSSGLHISCPEPSSPPSPTPSPTAAMPRLHHHRQSSTLSVSSATGSQEPSLIVEDMVGQLVETLFICVISSRSQNPAMWRRFTTALSRNPNWKNLVGFWSMVISRIAMVVSQQFFTHFPTMPQLPDDELSTNSGSSENGGNSDITNPPTSLDLSSHKVLTSLARSWTVSHLGDRRIPLISPRRSRSCSGRIQRTETTPSLPKDEPSVHHQSSRSALPFTGSSMDRPRAYSTPAPTGMSPTSSAPAPL
ncbi:hypothetical protein BJ085DRAFT_38281, partial [Dimargaris cristalligena]